VIERLIVMRAAMLGVALGLATGGGPRAYSKAPAIERQAPGYYRLRIGDVEITALSDGTNMLPAAALLINSTPAEINRLLSREDLADPVETSINAFLINTGAKLVLIDTGAGNLMGPGLGALLDNLRASGYQPAQVDEIYLTHMHPDHIGGLVVHGRRAFANAVLYTARPEAEYWLDPKNMEGKPEEVKQRFRDATLRVEPYRAAGKFVEFDAGVALASGIRALATPGHTPGHTSYVVESRGEKLVILGDLVHVAAVQFPLTGIALKFDDDPRAAVAQRESAFAAAARDGYWVAGAHLSFPGIGHVRAESVGYTWLPANYHSRS